MTKYTVTTKKQALEICIEMWDYIAEKGCDKATAVIDLHLPRMSANCACCEYAIYRRKKSEAKNNTCYYCPISSWKIKTGGSTISCSASTSPYSWWELTSGIPSKALECKQAAQEVANLARTELAKLTKKQEN